MIGRLFARLLGRRERPAPDSREVVALRAFLSRDGRVSSIEGVNAEGRVVEVVTITRGNWRE